MKLFIYAFGETVKTFDRQSLAELEKETERKNNWDDYVIPETLPQPQKTKTPRAAIPVIGGLIVSVTLGLVLAFISAKGIYIIGLFEFLVALVLAVVMKYLIRLSNYTDFSRLRYLLAAMILIVYFSNQYFQYRIILTEHHLDDIGFGAFLKLRLSAGLTVKKLNVGWVGLVVSWIIQLGLTGTFLYLRMVAVLSKYALERVPAEVVDFAFYHFIKGQSEEEVRRALAKKGWEDPKNQDEIFEAMGGQQNINELIRAS